MTSAILTTSLCECFGCIRANKTNISDCIECIKSIDLIHNIGLVLGPGTGKSKLIENLKYNDNYYFLDIDQHISLEDEKLHNSYESINNIMDQQVRNLFQLGKTIYDDSIEILNSSQHSVKFVIILSSDYRLLKYLGIKKIFYFLPSQNLINQIKKENPNFNDEMYQKVKIDMYNRKENKINIYDSFSDLNTQVINLFNVQLKV